MLDYPDLEPAERERFHAVVRDEVDAMSARLAALAADASQDLLTRWPLQEMLGADLVTAAAQRIEAEAGQPIAGTEVDDEPLAQRRQLRADPGARLPRPPPRRDPGPPTLTPPPRRRRRLGHLDLLWPADAAAGRRSDRLADRGDGPRRRRPRRSRPRDVAERHGGELWLEHDRPRGLSFFRFLLPLGDRPGRRGRRRRAPGILRLRPLRRQRRDAGRSTTGRWTSSPSPSSTPRPPASTRPEATRSSRWAPSAS